MKTPVNIHLSVLRWFDKVNGNSYFAARVYADGEEIAREPFQYGYGSHPDSVALLAAQRAGILQNNRWVYLSSACREAGIRFTENDYTAKKRDVVAHGKPEK